jgi:hypothetical protein
VPVDHHAPWAVANGDLRPLDAVCDAEDADRAGTAVRDIDPVVRGRDGEPDRRLAGADLLTTSIASRSTRETVPAIELTMNASPRSGTIPIAQVPVPSSSRPTSSKESAS